MSSVCHMGQNTKASDEVCQGPKELKSLSCDLNSFRTKGKTKLSEIFLLDKEAIPASGQKRIYKTISLPLTEYAINLICH